MYSNHNNIAIKKYHSFFIAALVCLLSLTCFLLIMEYRKGLTIDTDLRALLPEKISNNFSKTTSQRFYDALGNKIIFATSSHDVEQAKLAAQSAKTHVELHGQGFLNITPGLNEEMASLFRELKSNRFHLLTPNQKALIANNPDQVIEEAWQALFSFESILNTSAIKDDPLNLYNDYVKSRSERLENFSFEPPFLIINSDDAATPNYVILISEIKENALSLKVQEKLADLLSIIENDIATNHADVTLMKSGIAIHAAEAAARAKIEITFISIISILGIILLYSLAFSSLLPLLLSLLSIALGWLTAFAICHYIFSGLHIITLVFGATLIGVSIDYSLHYFTKLYKQKGSDHRFRPIATIFSAITLGLTTSILGYGSLLLAPLPGLNQVAIFSIMGLACSWLFVVSIYPKFSFKKINPPTNKLITLSLLPRHMWNNANNNTPFIVILVLLIIAIIGCLGFTSLSDNPRLLHKPSQQLVNDEKDLQAALKNYSTGQYFIVTGNTPQDVLLLEEQLRIQLDTLISEGKLGSYNAITQIVPSIATQKENYQLLKRQLYYPNSPLTAYLESLGYEADNIKMHFEDFEQQRNTLLTPDNWPGAKFNEFSILWAGRIDNRFVSTIMLRNFTDTSTLVSIANSFEDVFFIDKMNELGQVLGEQQSYAIKLLFTAYFVVMIVLAIRYKHFKAAGLVLIPLTSTLITLALFGLLNTPISLFHIFALFIILGLGLDYTIFMYESNNQDYSADLAIMLSAFTSCLSFGLLSFSHTPMVGYFGATILVGSLLNLLLAPFVCKLRPRSC